MKKSLLFLVAACFLQGYSAKAQSCTDVCPSVGLTSQYEWIRRVTLGPLFNQSGNNNGYADFGDTFFENFSAGSSYSYSMFPGYGDGPFSETWKAWMDFNQDGDFEDAGEQIISDFGQGAVSGSFSIPFNAVNGSIKLRISMGFAVNVLCDNVPEGEVEDYCVNIINGINPPQPCDPSEAPVNLSADITATNVVFSWTPPAGAEICRISGGLVGNFNLKENVPVNVTNFLSVPLSQFAAGNYNWKVRCACETSPAIVPTAQSVVNFFTISSTGVEPGIASWGNENVSVRAALTPNPTTGDMRIAVNVTGEARHQLIVADVLGRSVLEQNVFMVEGLNNLNLDVNHLPSGTYILMLRDGNSAVTTLRFIKE